MSDEKPKELPTFTVEVAVGPNPDGEADQARLAHTLPTDDESISTSDATLSPRMTPVKEN